MPAPSGRRIPDMRVGHASAAGFVQKVPARERSPLGRRNVLALSARNRTRTYLSIDRNVPEMANDPARSPTTIRRMVYTIENRDVVEIKRTNAFEASHIYTVLSAVRPALVEGIDAALRAEVVFCSAGIELVDAECLLTLLNRDPIEIGRNDNSATHPAVRAVTASCSAKTVRESDREADASAMAGSFGFGDIREHEEAFVRDRLYSGIRSCASKDRRG
jgi:hypothetical protein